MFARLNDGRAVAGILTSIRGRHWAARPWQPLLFATVAVLAAAVALPQSAVGAVAAPGVTFTKLTLLNGWGTSPFGSGRPAVAAVSGVVYFKGAISTSSSSANDVAFVLPPGLRPSKYVSVPVDMCNATMGELVNVLINVCTGSIGRLHITPKGVVTVRSEEGVWAVQCGTSLDGATFVLSPKSFTALKLKTGWINAPSGTAKAAVRNISGIVRFTGAIRAGGTSASPFSLPKGFRPAKVVYVPVDLCNGGNGRLDIQPDGAVTVQAESSFAEVQCLTSLDGAWFAR